MNDTSCVSDRQRRRMGERARRKLEKRAVGYGVADRDPLSIRLLPLLVLLVSAEAFALPTGGQVAAGNVAIGAAANNTLPITQTSGSAIVNWQGFSIAGNETVNIQQPNASAVMLNRVVGSNASVIYGHLNANGRVFLVNPAGVMFSPGSSVNVGSLVASTLGISDSDFLAGRYHFMAVPGQPGAKVTNQGTIQAGEGGTVAMLGAQVSNSGTVIAKLGTVAMGAGNDITLDFAGDGLTMLKINGPSAQASLENTGTLAADGGQVLMSVQSADALASTVLNQSGVVRAQSIAERNGRIVLDGGPQGVTQVAGTLDATGGTGLTGGQIDVTGQNVALLSGARVDASGAAGGGRVRFGGGAGGGDSDIRNAQAIYMAPDAQIHADALASGPGGHLVAYAANTARLYGTLSARGGAQGGDGGMIETSGHYLDTVGAKIDATAPKGAGGTWLIDPYNLEITSATSTDAVFTPSTGAATPAMFAPGNADSTIAPSDISAQLTQGTSVTIATGTGGPGSGGNITLDSGELITKGANASAGDATLILSAANSITLNGSITSTSGRLNLIVDANLSGATLGSHSITLSGGEILTNGGLVSIGVPQASVSTAGTTASDGASIYLSNERIDTSGLAPSGAYSGAVLIHGQGAYPIPIPNTTTTYDDAVNIRLSQINTSAGLVDIEGSAGAGQASRLGGVFFSDRSSVTTSTGNIQIFGAAAGPVPDTSVPPSAGVYFGDASLTTSTGKIDIRGNYAGAVDGGTDPTPGAEFADSSSIHAMGDKTLVEITGSTNQVNPGIEVLPSSNSSITAGNGGTIVLRSSSVGTTASLQVASGILSSSNGDVVLISGGVDPNTFELIDNVGAQIGLFFTPTSGLSIDSTTYDALQGFGTLILGSSGQNGKITVGGVSCDDPAGCAPNFNLNLTLESSGGGHDAIELQRGASMTSGHTLALLSTGTVTAPGGILADSLILSGNGNFMLTDPGNRVSVLSLVNAGGVYFSDPGSFAVGPAKSSHYDLAIDNSSVVDGTTSSLAGDVQLQALTDLDRLPTNLSIDAPIQKTGGQDATLTLSATGSLFDAGNSITSTAGKLNMVFDANSGGTTPGQTIQFSQGVLLASNGGDVSLGVIPGQPGSFDGASISLNQTSITTASATPGTSGSVTIHGHGAPNTDAVYIGGQSSVTTSAGKLEVEGALGTAGPQGGAGVVLVQGSSLSTDSGAILLYGAAVGPISDPYFAPPGAGVVIDASRVTTRLGSIDIRGVYTGAAPGATGSYFPPTANPISRGSGVGIEDGSSVTATGPGTSISIAGSTNQPLPGVIVGNQSSITAGQGGSVVLSALNTGTAGSPSSLSISNSTVSAPGGTLALVPGSVDPTSFQLVAANAALIGLFTPASGLGIDATTFGAFQGFQTIVLGSNQQTGSITVGGTSCSASGGLCRPVFSTDLTLASAGSGSQGIDLQFGASLPGHTLTLSSSGAVTDPGGIQAANLVLAGGGNFTLTDPGNNVGVLAIPSAGTVIFSQPGSFTIGPATSQTYDRSTGQFVPINATSANLTGDLQATSLNGGISLGALGIPTSITARGRIELIMENGEFDNVGGGTLTAGNAWHIWEASWIGETRGGLNPGGTTPNYYGCTFPGTCSWPGTVPLDANHFVYVARPTLTFTIGDGTRFVGAGDPQFTFTVAGLINGDTTTNSLLAGALTTTATAGSPPGQYPIVGSFFSPDGYLITVTAGTLTVTQQTTVTQPPPLPLNGQPFNRSGLQPLFTAQEQSFVYESNLGGINVCVGSTAPILALQQPEGASDTLAVEWKRVRSRPNLNSCLVVNGQHGCDEF
ncbi:two-partner secretion domain-containing protein [Paraburkholderia flagellata]|uniref:two-partner secretion domain-containing protein n=1 Tax=Paraburkholderia flagellata TaxID=2883241 RepID=UPI001F345754|nr:filamentous hemagglutinin N-terminal domain-containing protein [Paraburkholderia flagellata]